MKTSKRLAAVIFTAIIFLIANIAMAQKAGSAWVIPPKYKAMKSTVKAGDPEINSTGKSLFDQHCKSCHGTKGLGDGTKSVSLKTIVPSFADAKFKAQANGDVYFQSIVGRNEMPNFEKKITDEADRWALIAYIKSL